MAPTGTALMLALALPCGGKAEDSAPPSLEHGDADGDGVAAPDDCDDP